MAGSSATKTSGIGADIPAAEASAARASVRNAPSVIKSPWAKWAKRRMPKTSVTPIAPSA